MVKAEEELNRRRSSRNSRGAKNEEEDAVALVQAYLNAELAKNEEDAEANAMDVDGEASLDPQPAVHPGEPSEASVLDAMEGAAVSKGE